jgi:hypothetical protein
MSEQEKNAAIDDVELEEVSGGFNFTSQALVGSSRISTPQASTSLNFSSKSVGVIGEDGIIGEEG